MCRVCIQPSSPPSILVRLDQCTTVFITVVMQTVTTSVLYWYVGSLPTFAMVVPQDDVEDMPGTRIYGFCETA